MTKFPDNSLTWHHKIPWQFPDMGQKAKIPWHFFKIPWLFPDLEKILFFPDISLTRGNPVNIKQGLVSPVVFQVQNSTVNLQCSTPSSEICQVKIESDNNLQHTSQLYRLGLWLFYLFSCTTCQKQSFRTFMTLHVPSWTKVLPFPTISLKTEKKDCLFQLKNMLETT